MRINLKCRIWCVNVSIIGALLVVILSLFFHREHEDNRVSGDELPSILYLLLTATTSNVPNTTAALEQFAQMSPYPEFFQSPHMKEMAARADCCLVDEFRPFFLDDGWHPEVQRVSVEAVKCTTHCWTFLQNRSLSEFIAGEVHTWMDKFISMGDDLDFNEVMNLLQQVSNFL